MAAPSTATETGVRTPATHPSPSHARGPWISRASPGRRAAVPVELAPHLLALVLTFWALDLGDASAGLTAISIISVGFACWISLSRGGDYFVPSNVLILASGVFIGMAGYYLGQLELRVPLASVRDAAGLAMATTVGVSAVTIALSNRWHLRWGAIPHAETDPARHYRSPKHFELKALLLLGASQLPPIKGALGPVASAMAFGSVMMITLSASSKRVRLRWYGDVLVVALAFLVPYLWVELMFTGGGRLMVAGLGIASFIGWNLIQPRRLQKVLVILSIPVFLIFAGLDRLDGTTDSGSVVADGDGLGSVYSPLETWALIVEPKPDAQAARLGPRFGETFVNTFVLPVPSSLWENKPKGFGAELTEVFEPDLVDDNHSMAALIHGEWYANFGYAGIVLMMPALGYCLAILDRWHLALVTSRLATTRSWWSATTLLCICASLADLFWVGTFSLYARGGLAGLVIWAVGRLSTGRPLRPEGLGRRPAAPLARPTSDPAHWARTSDRSV